MSQLQHELSSGIVIDVKLADHAVFAGEELQLEVTFSNRTKPKPDTAPSLGAAKEALQTLRKGLETASNELGDSSLSEKISFELYTPSTERASPPSLDRLHVDPLSGTVFETDETPLSAPVVSKEADESKLFRNASLRRPKPETGSKSLLMGYVQLLGEFEPNASLINTAIFENAKHSKMVLGSTAGGVIGVGKQPNNFHLGFFNFNLKSSLFGQTELSSLADTQDATRAGDSIPLFSTPQSVLFVDLNLMPGEQRSYSYSMTLPSALPPTCRGTAFKFAYKLIIGIQCHSGGVPIPSTVTIPFRVYPKVTVKPQLGLHSLTHPIAILRDEAVVRPITGRGFEKIVEKKIEMRRRLSSGAGLQESREDFYEFMKDIIHTDSQSRRPSISSPLVSSSSFSDAEEMYSKFSSRDAIDYLVRQSAANKPQIFNVSWKHGFVAAVNLHRQFYRLGDRIFLNVDMQNSTQNCVHISAALETNEVVNESIALKSAEEISRLTTVVACEQSSITYGQVFVGFSFVVPPGAVPSFKTEEVTYQWAVKITFVIQEDAEGSVLSSVLHENENEKMLRLAEAVRASKFVCRFPVQILSTNLDIRAVVPGIRLHGTYLL
ncbi:hypothetical protein CANCADRAFT_43770 [Tortispora caseinolytica NRRL Y-17796]|uniref:Rgp1-domain-containing protein n=1 Tax=Tortispora caseinolytica NRRL Y-17796 TaxID=767744 RepID=A0A1E4TEE9_9ASCO|nr:hypothetical protein CANCADRAFT_43770 [Tortispora caseinolytica NRRL Y-17796]